MQNISGFSSSHNLIQVYDSGLGGVGGFLGFDIKKIDDIQSKVNQIHSAVSYADFTEYIPATTGYYCEINNSGGYASIGFHITSPTGGTVQFQGSFDGVNYSPITFRQIGNDGYAQNITISAEDYIGSISTLRKIRFVTTASGAGSGIVIGRMSKEVSTLEGMEHDNPPHKFGHTPFHRGFVIVDSTISNSGIYTPSLGRKFIVTYLTFGAISTVGANITFHEGSGNSMNANKWIFTTYVKTSATDSQFFNATETTPFVADELNTQLCLTCDAATSLRGVLHGYEAEN